jgi:hypothetical protein
MKKVKAEKITGSVPSLRDWSLEAFDDFSNLITPLFLRRKFERAVEEAIKIALKDGSYVSLKFEKKRVLLQFSVSFQDLHPTHIEFDLREIFGRLEEYEGLSAYFIGPGDAARKTAKILRALASEIDADADQLEKQRVIDQAAKFDRPL